jgi:hypothetical protein
MLSQHTLYGVWEKWCIITTEWVENLKTKQKCGRKNSVEGIIPEISWKEGIVKWGKSCTDHK